MNCWLGAPPPETKIAPVAGLIAIPVHTLPTLTLSATFPACATIKLTLWSCQPAVLAKTVLPSGLTMIFITISPGNAICRPAGVIFQPLGSNAPLPSCVGPGLTTPAQSASFRQLPASAMADASIISAEVATNNRRFICHPQKSVGQTGSLPGLLDRPHRRSQGKLPVCPTLAPRFSFLQVAATGMKAPAENRFVVPPLGGSVGCGSIP